MGELGSDGVCERFESGEDGAEAGNDDSGLEMLSMAGPGVAR